MLEEIPFEAQKVAHGLLAQDGLNLGYFPPCLELSHRFPPCLPVVLKTSRVTAARRARGLCLLPRPSRRIWQGGHQHGRHDLTGNEGDVMLAGRKGHGRSLKYDAEGRPAPVGSRSAFTMEKDNEGILGSVVASLYESGLFL